MIREDNYCSSGGSRYDMGRAGVSCEYCSSEEGIELGCNGVSVRSLDLELRSLNQQA